MYIFCGGKTYNEFGEYEDVFSAMEKLPDGKYVCKPVLGQCGRDIIVITVNGGQVVLGENITLSELKVNFEKEDYIVQEFLTQHESMAALNKSSVNTVRITTTRFNENAYLFTAMARIGIGDTLVDNAAAGGTCVGIDLETGKLMKFGCYHDKPKETRHPITGIEYEGFQIPFWEESTQIVKHLHRFYKGFPSLGWDVAITPEGPKIIENNYDWAFGIMQQIHGGLKKRWEQAKSLK